MRHQALFLLAIINADAAKWCRLMCAAETRRYAKTKTDVDRAAPIGFCRICSKTLFSITQKFCNNLAFASQIL